MNYVMSKSEKAFQILNNIGLGLLCILMLYPFVNVIAISFSTPAEALRVGLHIIPLEFSLDAYRNAFDGDGIWIGFKTSLFRTVVGTILSMIFLIAGAYPLSKKYLPHRRFYTLLILFTMFFSGGLIPSYMLVKNLGLLDSVWSLILPILLNTFNLLILKNFFQGLPAEVEESAKIDGANDIRILISIIIPLSMPIIATLILWTSVNHWNAWFDALMYISDRNKMVLQIYLRKLIVSVDDSEIGMLTTRGNLPTPETVKAAVLFITTFPILIVYPFLQKYFVKGVMIGAVKG